MSVAESFTLLSIALSTIILRTWYRWSQVGFGGFAVDDYLMPVCGVLFAVVTTLAYLVGANYGGLTNSYMTDEERAALDPSSREAYNRQMGSKIQIVGWSCYAMELWLLKLCVTVFYSRLTTRLGDLNTRVLIAYWVIGISYAAVALSIVLGCQPMSKNWQINPYPGNLCEPTTSKLNVLMVYVPNVVTDLYLLSIPMPLLWRVNISLRRKVTLMCLFSGAIFVITAATIRAVVIITAGPEGAISSSLWACREVFVSTIVTNLPVIQPVLRRAAHNIGLSVLFSKSGGKSSGNAGHGASGRSYPLSSNLQQGGVQSKGYGRGDKSRSAREANTTTTIAAWDSDEHILLDDNGGKVGTGSESTPGKKKGITVGTEVTVMREEIGVDLHERKLGSKTGRSSPTSSTWTQRTGNL